MMARGQGSSDTQGLTVKKTRQRQASCNGRKESGTQSYCGTPLAPFSARGQIFGPESISLSRYPLEEQQFERRAPFPLHTDSPPSLLPSDTELSRRSPQHYCIGRGRTSHILSPCVVVTPECPALEAGQRSLWAAVEVSGRLCAIPGNDDDSGVITSSFMDYALDPFFEYGCLHDLAVEVLPIDGCTIVQVLRQQDFPTTIYAGCNILLLVRIYLSPDHSHPPRQSGHARQKSDELMEDLEIQLGSSQVPYMQIRVTYSHSAFPESYHVDATAGVSSMRTRMETTATAILKRHNTSSMWSPRPSPVPNPLYPLLMRHWGAGKARDAMQQVLTHRSNPRMLAKGGTPDADDLRELPISLGHVPPVIPRRQASLQDFVTRMVPVCENARTEQLGQQVVSPRASCVPEVAKGFKKTVVSGDDSQGSTTSRSGWQAEVSPTERSNSPILNTRLAGVVGIRGLMPRLSDFATERCASREKGSDVEKKPQETRVLGRWGWGSWF